MPEYTVHFVQTISAVVTVDASDPDAAIDAAQQDPKMPGAMAGSAFRGADVSESGDWVAAAVLDESGEEVWTEEDDHPA